MIKIFLYAFVFIFMSCAQVTSLNLKKHQFGQIPTKIIWIQVSGLQEEHLALLKFSKQSAEQTTAFEESLCIGKSWEYNLYDIRPSASASFMSQITGKKNIKNTCEDYQLKPVWKYVVNKGYRVGIFESEMSKEESLLKADRCNEKDYLSDVVLWKMDKSASKSEKLFHTSEKEDFAVGTTYYDKSCLTGECYSTFSQNVTSVFEQFSRKSSNYIFLVRDFKFSHALNRKNIKQTRSDLIELDKTIQYFQNEANKRNDMLVLVTTAAVKSVDFPKSGKEWEQFEKNGKYFSSRKTKLINSIFASGARAENFCGIYDQSKILTRIFSGAKQQGLELAIINPFD